jgi:glutamate synthase domain-containing protein 2
MRKVFYGNVIFGFILTFVLYQFWDPAIYFLYILIPYTLIGIHDILSVKHNILRNYPVIGHFRYMLESIRPEIQQYFIEDDQHGAPYPREIRSLVYQQSKGVRDTIAFGTKNDITSAGYHFSYHSLSPKEVKDDKNRLIFGGKDCKKPYHASRLNISGMSYGALSPNAIRELKAAISLIIQEREGSALITLNMREI